jgi:hypothetical protein
MWGVLDSIADVSKPECSPLVYVQSPKNSGRYIKLSRVWNSIDANSPLKIKEISNLIRSNLFDDWAVVKDQDFRDQLIEPMSELLEEICSIKNQEVYFLQISAYTALWTQQEYNEAIVTVFTRLNAAGRALKDEEITMAWLKVGWEPSLTNSKTAAECREDLRKELDPIFAVENEEDVKLISYVWAIFHKNGRLLEARDLLDGQIMQPMALQISTDWIPFIKSINQSVYLIQERNLKDLLNSFNAIIVACSVYYLYLLWQNENSAIWNSMREVDRENCDKRIESIFNPFLDRWLLCSHWAGTWSNSSGLEFQAFAIDISKTWANRNRTNLSTTAFINDFEMICTSILDRVKPKAIVHVNTLEASRNTVSQYRSILWLWHRLDKNRFIESAIQMRLKPGGKRRSQMKMEVDHAVSYSSWCDLVEVEVTQQKNIGALIPTGEIEPPPIGFASKMEAVNFANRIGNCSLLQTNFNRSKNKGTLWNFMKQVQEFTADPSRKYLWENALGMSAILTEMLGANSSPATCLDIKQAIEIRTNDIRKDVVAFITNKTQGREI